MVKKIVLSSSLLLVVLLFLSLRSQPLAVSPRALILPPDVSAQDGALCPPLPLPSGTIVNVSTVSGLESAVNGASSGDTILLADGTYALNGVYLWIDVPNVTVRSASGNREAVIIDGNYNTTEIVTIAASNVTIADLTLQRAETHPIHVVSTSSGDTLNARIYNVHIVDPGQQAIKINPYRPDGALYYPDDGVIACSHIELTDAGRSQVWAINGSCYTGGVDAHQARGWSIRDNLIEGFWCPGEGGGCDGHELSEHGIHLWRGCRDTVVERNVLRDNARGIGFGLMTSGYARTYADSPCPSAGGGYVGHYDGVIRNNFIYANRSELFISDCGYDSGISLWQACGARALHNTAFSTQAPYSSIEWRFSNSVVEITNNLVNYPMQARDGASAAESGNVTNAQADWFVDATAGDLHLVPAATNAIDQVAAPVDVPDDIDGDARPIGAASDVGADEYGVPVPAAVTDLRVTNAVTSTWALTVTLGWTGPADAVTTTVRYANAVITEGNWDSTSPLTDTLPGSAEVYTATVSYEGGTLYFALRTENATGVSDLSNVAFWPHQDVCLPVVLKGY